MKSSKLQKRKLSELEKLEILKFMAVNPKVKYNRVAKVFTERYKIPIGKLTIYLIKVFCENFFHYKYLITVHVAFKDGRETFLGLVAHFCQFVAIFKIANLSHFFRINFFQSFPSNVKQGPTIDS